MHWIRTRLSFANVISVIALFVALGGASYAAVTLPKNSVGVKQIKKNGVGASEIKRNAVGASEIKSNAVAGPDVRNGGLTGTDIGDGSLGGADITDASIANLDLGDNSVGSSEIADGSVGAGDLAPLVAGPTAFARVQADGTLEPGTDATGGPGPSQFKGVDATDVQKAAGLGIYCFGDLGFKVASAVVSMDNAGAAATTTEVASVAIQRGNNLGSCDAGHQQARVVITNVDPALANDAPVDGRFTVWFMGG